MALIKSKQIKDLIASKIVTTNAMQFVSDVEKLAYLDKYTKVELDNITTAIVNDHEADVVTINESIVALTTAMGNNSTDIEEQLDTMNTALQAQITNAVAGITWKVPVATYVDLATVYPVPAEGWMVTIEDTNKVFRYDAVEGWSEFPIQLSSSYSKTIVITVANGQEIIPTGIRNDGTGVHKTSHEDIVFNVNGFAQGYGALKDYTTEFVDNELVVTWLNRSFSLDADDEITVTYTHFDIT